MMDLFCTVLELLFLVLSVAIGRKSAVDDERRAGINPVSDMPEETLEFFDCAVCGKPNQIGRVSCSACGTPRETART